MKFIRRPILTRPVAVLCSRRRHSNPHWKSLEQPYAQAVLQSVVLTRTSSAQLPTPKWRWATMWSLASDFRSIFMHGQLVVLVTWLVWFRCREISTSDTHLSHSRAGFCTNGANKSRSWIVLVLHQLCLSSIFIMSCPFEEVQHAVRELRRNCSLSLSSSLMRNSN